MSDHWNEDWEEDVKGSPSRQQHEIELPFEFLRRMSLDTIESEDNLEEVSDLESAAAPSIPSSRHSKRSSRSSKKRSKRSINDMKRRKRKLERNGSDRSSLTSCSGSTKARNYSKQEIEDQTRDLDEALILYGYAEKAARKIQLVFRERQQEKFNQEKSSTEIESEDLETPNEKDDDDASEQDNSKWYTLIFLILTTLAACIPKLFGLCETLLGGDDTGATDAANVAMQGGGGGPAGPTPTGGEGAGAAGGGAQAGAQSAMAAQAASSAASGAASGVASGAAAGGKLDNRVSSKFKVKLT
mmetsp:Transcript_31348/g.75500  ORF Transcript_31348/g.75500 Transcript_31348/m.75500 type:complete len:300 (+) Transcript_31348:94-993(+)